MPRQKGAVIKASAQEKKKNKNKKKTTAFYRHEKHYRDILSKSRQMPAVSVFDQRCYNMGHGKPMSAQGGGGSLKPSPD